MADLFLPTLHTFAMNNIFTGSYGPLRFRAVPNVIMLNAKEVNFDESSIFVEYWHGLFCYEKSEMEGSETFPMSEEGRQAMLDWLKSKVYYRFQKGGSLTLPCSFIPEKTKVEASPKTQHVIARSAAAWQSVLLSAMYDRGH